MKRAASLISLGCRILHADGHDHLCFGHVSARREDGGFHIKEAGLGLEEVGEADVITIHANGDATPAGARLHDELALHREIYAARSDVGSVVHTHAREAVVASLDPDGWAVVCQDGVPFVDRVAFYDDCDLVTTPEHGKQLALVLGDARAVLLRGHGLVAVGSGVEEAVVNAVQLRRALEHALAARAAGLHVPLPDAQVRLLNGRFEGARARRIETIWSYLVRQLEAQAPAEVSR